MCEDIKDRTGGDLPCAMEIARFLCFLPTRDDPGDAAMPDSPDLLTPRRLEHLLYIMQGCSLVLRGEPLYRDDLVGHPGGPAPQAIVRAFGQHHHLPICPARDPPADLSSADQAFVRAMWQQWAGLSVTGLRRWLGRERLWSTCHAEARDRRNWEPAPRVSLDALRDAFDSAPKPGTGCEIPSDRLDGGPRPA